MDSTRSPINPVATFFNADGTSEVNTSARQTDFLSNGFKFRGNNAATNASATYVYLCFAEHPFVGDGNKSCDCEVVIKNFYDIVNKKEI